MKIKDAQVFLDKDEIMQKILDLPQKMAEEWGVRRNTFQGVKKRIRGSGDVNLGTPAVRRLIMKCIL